MSDTDTAAPTDDLRSALTEIYEGIEARDTADEALTEKAHAARAEDAAERGNDDADDGPVRGPDGKFVSKNPPEESPADTPDQPEEAEPEPAQPAIDAPQSWSAPMKEHWASLPSDVQSYIAQREGEAHKQITETGERLKRFEPLQQLLEPRAQQFAAEGMTEHQAIGQLFALSDMAARDPGQFIQWFAQQRGIDLAKFAQQQTSQPAKPGSPQPTADPRIAQLEKNQQALMAHLQQSQQATVNAAVRTFREAKNEAGEPLHPHYDAVEATMPALIKSVRTAEPHLAFPDLLSRAYEQAVWARPDIREQLLAAQRAEAQRQADEDARKRAAQAKKAAPVKSSGTSGGEATKGRTMRESLENAYSRATAA